LRDVRVAMTSSSHPGRAGRTRLESNTPSRTEVAAMSFKARQIGPCFAAEVEGIDMRKPLSPEDVKAIHAGMDEYAVLVFHEQFIDDEQQLAFTRSLGELERSVGASLRAPEDYRLPTTFADVSNLDKEGKPFAREDRRRL